MVEQMTQGLNANDLHPCLPNRQALGTRKNKLLAFNSAANELQTLASQRLRGKKRILSTFAVKNLSALAPPQ